MRTDLPNILPCSCPLVIEYEAAKNVWPETRGYNGSNAVASSLELSGTNVQCAADGLFIAAPSKMQYVKSMLLSFTLVCESVSFGAVCSTCFPFCATWCTPEVDNRQYWKI